MSAPIEVWVEDYGNGVRMGLRDTGVRYLRADLTCGECGLFMKVECPKDALCGRNGTIEPACMAFKPKEKK